MEKNLHQRLKDYQPHFSELAQRAERGRVETKYGRQIFDSELREPYEVAEAYVNALLEELFAQTAEVEFIKATADVELADPSVILPTPEEIEEYGQGQS